MAVTSSGVVYFPTINSFVGLPPVKYIFDLFNSRRKTVVIQNTIGNFNNYLSEADEHISLIDFPNNNGFNGQSSSQKVSKYIKLVYFLLSKVKWRSAGIVYCVDLFTLVFCLSMKKWFGLKNLYLIYSQFEVVEPEYLNKQDRFLFKQLKKKKKYLNLSIFPEANRLKYFQEITGIKDESGLTVIPNSNLSSDPKPLTKTDKIIITHVGSVGEGHYINNFIEAIKDLPGDRYEVWFVGILQPSVVKTIENANLDHVILIPQVPHNELKEIYSKTDIGIILYKDLGRNYRFCAPNKLYEYWSNGIPVIGHKLPGLMSVFKSELQGQLVDMEVPEDIFNAISKLDTSMASREGLRNLFRSEYDLQPFLSKLDRRVDDFFIKN